MARVTRTFGDDDGNEVRATVDKYGDIWFENHDGLRVFLLGTTLASFLKARPAMVDLAQDEDAASTPVRCR